MFSIIKKYVKDLKSTDLRKIRVTSEGDFYIKSKDLFDNKERSIELIDSLQNSVNQYKKRTQDKVSKNIEHA